MGRPYLARLVGLILFLLGLASSTIACPANEEGPENPSDPPRSFRLAGGFGRQGDKGPQGEPWSLIEAAPFGTVFSISTHGLVEIIDATIPNDDTLPKSLIMTKTGTFDD